jgi:hypothetical protein
LLGKLRGERKEVTSVSLKIGNRQLAIDMLLRVSVYRS